MSVVVLLSAMTRIATGEDAGMGTDHHRWPPIGRSWIAAGPLRQAFAFQLWNQSVPPSPWRYPPNSSRRWTPAIRPPITPIPSAPAMTTRWNAGRASLSFSFSRFLECWIVVPRVVSDRDPASSSDDTPLRDVFGVPRVAIRQVGIDVDWRHRCIEPVPPWSARGSGLAMHGRRCEGVRWPD